MIAARRKAKLAAVDGLMKMLGNMDSQRMATMSQNDQEEDGSSNLGGTAQLADKNDSEMVLQTKGSDSDINENTLNQPRAAPPNQDPTDGDPEGQNLAEKDDGSMLALRDAADRGDSTARRIMELFGDEPENDTDETTELEPSDTQETVTSDGSLDDGDLQRGMESAPTRLAPVKEKNLGASTGTTSGYVGGDIGRPTGQVGMGTVKLPRRRR